MNTSPNRKINLLSTFVLCMSFLTRLFGQTQAIDAPPIKSGPPSSIVRQSAVIQIKSTDHEKFASFRADQGFKSELLLENLRIDEAITVKPAFIFDHEEIPFDPIELQPHSSINLNVNAILAAHHLAERSGLVVVRYNAPNYTAVSATVTLSDEKDRIYLSSVGQSHETYMHGTTLDAVIWSPDKQTEGFISIINTTTEPRQVQERFITKEHGEEKWQIILGSHGHRLVPLNALLERSQISGAGIHLSYSGAPGDIIAEGSILNRKTGFAKFIRFMDMSKTFADTSLRTHFLLLGQQPVADGFPSEVSFHSVAALRNTLATPVEVTPVIRRLRNDGAVEKFSLKPLALGPDESQILDFNNEQKAGSIPADFNQGSLQLMTNSPQTSLVAELFNFNQRTGGFVVGTSFSAFPARGTGSIWKIDGTFQTTLVIENTAQMEDKAILKLFSEDRAVYEKSITIPSNGIVKLNLRELQEKSIPDDHGKRLTATSGTLSLAGSLAMKSRLSFDKLIHSADEAEYVGLLANPCNVVENIQLQVTGSINPFGTLDTWFWSDGSQSSSSGAPSISDMSVAFFDNNGNLFINVSPDGLNHSAMLTETDMAPQCDVCSNGTYTSSVAVNTPIPDHLLVLSDKTTSQSCNGNTSAFRKITYEIQDQNNVQITRPISLRENVPVTTSSCNNQTVQTGRTCFINTSDDPGVVGEFSDFLSAGCPVPASNSPCGFDFPNQQWQWCPSAAPPQSTGTIGPVKVRNTLINVNGNVLSLTGTVFQK